MEVSKRFPLLLSNKQVLSPKLINARVRRKPFRSLRVVSHVLVVLIKTLEHAVLDMNETPCTQRTQYVELILFNLKPLH